MIKQIRRQYERASNALEKSFLFTAIACFIVCALTIGSLVLAQAHAGKLGTSDKIYLLAGGSVAYIAYMVLLYFVRFRAPSEPDTERQDEQEIGVNHR